MRGRRLIGYTHEQIESLQTERGFLAKGERLEQQRCEADLVYALHNRPDLAVDDESVLIDRILRIAIAIRNKKYGTDISRDVTEATQFVLSPQADHWVKLFVIYSVLCQDQEEMAPLFKEAYVAEFCFFTDPKEHFSNWVQHFVIPQYEMWLSHAYGDGDIVQVIRHICGELKRAYMIK